MKPKPESSAWPWQLAVLPMAVVLLAPGLAFRALVAIKRMRRWAERWPMPEKIHLLSNEEIDALPEEPDA